MANTAISDIADEIGLGENVEQTFTAAEASIKPGMWVYKHNATGIKRMEGSSSKRIVLGVVGCKYDHTTIDTAYSNNETGIPVYTRGSVAAFNDDPGAAKYAGARVYESGATAGSAGWAAEDEEAFSGAQGEMSGVKTLWDPIAELQSDLANGDTVGIYRIL